METLRLGNVAEVAIPHYTLSDTTLTGYRVPKDTVVMINLMAVHLDPSLWENPNSFDPRRHIDSDGQLITNSGSFLPFSAGRRVCAGEALAKVELFLFLSWMLHRFTFLPSEDGNLPDLKGENGFTRFPAAYKIRVEKRPNMPPGPRLTSLPFIGNLMSFDSGESFGEITASHPWELM
ncbi:hypothetical protein pdam_00022751 [Pocillopora damicornis]|uniref:Cytochrome P450 n=2 Tax=Pocillopora damicornis TaxID=46731 RepID=A0A3M6UPI8_POCDA|nr:hypothetical protein pdam_00022751 [Pocillopora damicornis]